MAKKKAAPKKEQIVIPIKYGNFTKSYFTSNLVMQSKGAIDNSKAGEVFEQALKEGAIQYVSQLGLVLDTSIPCYKMVSSIYVQI